VTADRALLLAMALLLAALVLLGCARGANRNGLAVPSSELRLRLLRCEAPPLRCRTLPLADR